MSARPQSLAKHRVRSQDNRSILDGQVRWSPVQSLWFTTNCLVALIGGAMLFSWSALLLFVVSTGIVLLFGHSLGSHRKLIHNSFQCPRWLERVIVYLGVQVGLAGPIGLLRQHELRDYAQRLPDCHPYLRHGSGFWRDAWWQLHCELRLAHPPAIHVEERIASDGFYQLLERTWMWQQLPVALLLFGWGGWGFVVYGVCARVTAGVFGHWLIGYFAHNHGPMHHEVRGAAVQGHNIRWTSLLTMGECWHNNHHAFPGSAKLGLQAGEWDPGWWILRLLQKLGLVWSLRLPADLPPRPELVAIAERAKSRDGGALVWPGRTIGLVGMRRLLAAGVQITLDRDARRLTYRTPQGRVLRGLPALLTATAQDRGLLARMTAWIVLPMAFAIESTRADGTTC